MRQVSNRKAFTLVELLVAIAVIGVLVALLLPAVQAATTSVDADDRAIWKSQFGAVTANAAEAFNAAIPELGAERLLLTGGLMLFPLRWIF